jgi:hypothetical protein
VDNAGADQANLGAMPRWSGASRSRATAPASGSAAG